MKGNKMKSATTITQVPSLDKGEGLCEGLAANPRKKLASETIQQKHESWLIGEAGVTTDIILSYRKPR